MFFSVNTDEGNDQWRF